jgi:hypothetical protein
VAGQRAELDDLLRTQVHREYGECLVGNFLLLQFVFRASSAARRNMAVSGARMELAASAGTNARR